MNAYYKDALTKKIKIPNIDKISLGQYKPEIFRVVVANNKNVKTSYNINNKQLIITIKKEKRKNIQNKYIDKYSSIRSITTQDDRIIVKFNKNFSKKYLKYHAFKKSGKFYDVFDIRGNYRYVNPLKLAIDNIDKITVYKKNSKTIRLQIRDTKDLKVYYIIKKRELIIKIKNINRPVETSENIMPNIPVLKNINTNKTIVIDAGHGAKDVGAVGPKKRYEKVVTLKVSKYLQSLLKKRGYKVYLTRYNDRFIKVKNRTILANKKNADLFISIHANSVVKSKARKVHGIETFFLSPARSERAKRVAAKENSSDIRYMSSSTKNVFLESLNRPRITASHKLAIDVQAGLLQSVRKSYKNVKDSGVREGPFWVLVGAQMPSILIELGYMSHPIESQRLYSSKYQKLLANGIANGIDSYFLKNP